MTPTGLPIDRTIHLIYYGHVAIVKVDTGTFGYVICNLINMYCSLTI